MRHNKVYLQHILDEFEFLLRISKNLDFDSFTESEMYTRAFSRSFEIIGEAVKHLSPEFRASNNHIEWNKIAGMRDKIIHDYFNVDYEIIWDVIKNKLPSIREEIKQLLNQ